MQSLKYIKICKIKTFFNIYHQDQVYLNGTLNCFHRNEEQLKPIVPLIATDLHKQEWRRGNCSKFLSKDDLHCWLKLLGHLEINS